MLKILDLINKLQNEKRAFIQTHNFPDHDAVASAYGLSNLLLEFGIETHIIYKGEIQRDSLIKMIENLQINISKYENFDIKEDDKIIVVDGCKGNSNVEGLNGTEIAIIDHHDVSEPENIEYVDIRSNYGACSTIIYTYYKELKKVIPRNIATALIIGLNVDTSQLTRRVSLEDINAFHSLYIGADIHFVNSVLRNYIKVKDLNFYNFLLNNIKINSSIAFCYFKDGCNQNLLGILSDFVLSIEEIDFVILCAKNNGAINFSIRNEKNGINAASIIQKVLKGLGLGGGHADMAGGVIKDIAKFDEQKIYNLFTDAIENTKR
ncbi:recombinase RecJ [Clostridium carboxidivorans P7]|uniref:Phosphoesterase RecJ domain protein n=1 Tax=Clostridium carboxidivorans P7 TaxID=536227 RepID=C6PNS8_9CLOT|nr:DHHA1 domain-containing protein [Clostridium carboxidivorans]AKN31314.1 recombinase RecJ [Clostridium carboxidivorans P7]EET89006.1 phosphoesterase RecJ domain protein [Clostridium carboxidivorans P7]EFG88440.1 DHHA1 domain protein [Clostridium carboxidivorans P7]